jgi:hypothetical protein
MEAVLMSHEAWKLNCHVPVGMMACPMPELRNWAITPSPIVEKVAPAIRLNVSVMVK